MRIDIETSDGESPGQRRVTWQAITDGSYSKLLDARVWVALEGSNRYYLAALTGVASGGHREGNVVTGYQPDTRASVCVDFERMGLNDGKRYKLLVKLYET